MKRGSRHLGKITDQHSRPQFHLSLLGSLASYGRGGTWQRKKERLNRGGVKGRTISLWAAVHLGHMLRALMTKSVYSMYQPTFECTRPDYSKHVVGSTCHLVSHDIFIEDSDHTCGHKA